MRVGIDIGGTKIVMGLVDESGAVLARERFLTQKDRGYEDVVSRVIQGVEGMIQRQGVALGGPLTRIGCASAGQIDPETGRIYFSPNLSWRDVPLKEDLTAGLKGPVLVENDVNAATYGEWRFGLKGGPRHAVGIFIGTGIGGGLILDGRLYRGFSGVAAELGHITLNPLGYRCNCGNRGCFEAYCGGSYVVRRVQSRLNEGYRGKLWDIIEGDIEGLNTGHIEAAWMAGDDLCRKVWDEVILYFGLALQSIANLLNPEVIICGGGVVNGAKNLLGEAVGVMDKIVMPASRDGLRVEKATRGDDATILGVSFIED